MTAIRDWAEGSGARLTVDGTSLECCTWGPPPESAPTLVLLHEGLGSVAQWKNLPERLVSATGCGVLAYSRAGYGRSDTVTLPRPLNYQTLEAESVLGTVLNAFGIGKAVLLGHSDGATIAAIYAGSVSDLRVCGLILIAPHFFAEPAGLRAIAAAGQAFAQGDLRRRLAKYHDDVDAAFCGWHDAWISPGFADWDVSDVIDHWRIPVLAIQGTDDPYGTLAQITEIEDRIYAPFEKLILCECGHAPQLEKPTETDAAIARFCARLFRLEHAKVEIS
tara:strand:- start:1091 stop:1921 length:831 start_codon:yes stop_codon:yes gene_type:complete